MKKTFKYCIGSLGVAVMLLGCGVATDKNEKSTTKTVSPETFVRAETDNMYAAMIENAGGTNRFFHFRSPTPLDKQTVVRMNRDVLYSGGVFDAEQELTIQFPEMPDDRYVSVYVISNDHYVVDIIHEPGAHQVKGDTRFLYLIVRVQVKDAFDEGEIAMINALQDKFIVTSETNEEFPGFHWDRASLDSLRADYEKEYSANYSSYAGMMGKRGEVNEETRHLAAATGWGLFPEEEATYLAFKGSGHADACYKATYTVPENTGFWSITVYGDDGYMKSDHNLINGSNVKLNDDGTFTAYFGSEAACGEVPNRADITDGWNFLMRIYLPGESVLKGEYVLAEATEVK